MVCSLHSVTTGSRDRANVPLIIIGGRQAIYRYMGFANLEEATSPKKQKKEEKKKKRAKTNSCSPDNDGMISANQTPGEYKFAPLVAS